MSHTSHPTHAQKTRMNAPLSVCRDGILAVRQAGNKLCSSSRGGQQQQRQQSRSTAAAAEEVSSSSGKMPWLNC